MHQRTSLRSFDAAWLSPAAAAIQPFLSERVTALNRGAQITGGPSLPANFSSARMAVAVELLPDRRGYLVGQGRSGVTRQDRQCPQNREQDRERQQSRDKRLHAHSPHS